MWADYFVTACRTEKGFSVLLIPRDDNVETNQIKTSYSTTAGTAFVEFNNAKVPVENLLGDEHKGFIVVMSNFNHERFMMVCAVVRATMNVVEECMKWCNQRIVFGKRLVDQPVIRQKYVHSLPVHLSIPCKRTADANCSRLARMISLTESNQAWLESIAYQMCNMTYAEQSKLLGGPIGLLKSHVTRCAGEVAEQATNIFGGRGITQSGMGRVIEMFNRTYKFDAILGGTEEILADLGVRQAFKTFPKAML